MKYKHIIVTTLLSAGGRHAAASSSEDLQARLLHDMMHQYIEFIATDSTVCPPSTATTFSDDYPGNNPASNWDTLTTQDFEASLFQTLMSYDDTTGDDSWDIRIGTGGNIYSHFVPDRYGERVAPQANPEAPWIDEVSDVVHMICTHDMCT